MYQWQWNKVTSSKQVFSETNSIEHFHHPQRSLILLPDQLPIPTPKANAALISITIDWFCPFWNSHTGCTLWDLASCAQVFLRFICVVAFICRSRLLWLRSIPLHGYTIICFLFFVFHFLTGAHYGCYKVWALTYKDSMTISYVSLCVRMFSFLSLGHGVGICSIL